MGLLKKATNLRDSFGPHASGVLAHFPVLTYWKYAPRAKLAVALLDGSFDNAQGMLF